MNRWTKITVILALTMVCALCLGEDGEDAYMEGSVSVGGHFSDVEDSEERAAEYETIDEDGAADIELKLFHNRGDRFMKVEADIRNEYDLWSRVRIHSGSGVRNEFSYRRFIHRLDHDYLKNITARSSADPEANTPGGMMFTHEDRDPDGSYGVTITELKNELEVDVGSHIICKWGYGRRTRKGYRQAISVNKCSMCHVVGRRARVDETTLDHHVGFSAVFPKLQVIYEFVSSEFTNHAAAPTNFWDAAKHPVSDDMGGDFPTRVIYGDEEGEYSRTPDTKKQSHELKINGMLTDSHSIVGAFSMFDLENELEDLTLESKTGSAAWYYNPEGNFKLTTTFSRESLDNDDVFIDLDPWREGYTGGGQDFDWTRYSAYNRDVTVGRVQGSYQLNKVNGVSFDYRYRSIDREYLELYPDSSEKETVQNRVQMSWHRRKPICRSTFTVEYELTDYPFANKDAMCEPSYENGETLPDNSSFYYFQRERLAAATNQPTDSLRIKFNGSLFSGTKASLNLQASYQDEKNDELNEYQWERDMLISGLNLFAAPNQVSIFTLGYNFLDITSNALFCIPVMDG